MLMSGGLLAQADQFATRGREFWLGFMQNAGGTQELSLHIASATATSGTVSIPLAGWSTNYVVAANEVTTVVVPNSYEIIGSEVPLDLGVHVTSVDPVTVSAINFLNVSTDAFQVLPVESLGIKYRVEALPGNNYVTASGTYVFRSEFVIVATEDGTSLQITPSGTTTAGRPANVPFSINLNAGQTYQVQALNGNTDLTGTLIQATDFSGPCRPFAVFGGSMCSIMGCAACDYAAEQTIPMSAWGTNFHTVPLGNTVLYGYRVQAGENNTSVSIDGGAAVTLNAGEYHQVMNAAQPVCITGDKPISVTEFMLGATCAGNGDPSLLVLEPDDRMSTSSNFSTFPSVVAYSTHYISVLAQTGTLVQVQVDGTPVPSALWSTYAACAGYSVAKIPVSEGSHLITSSGGFIAYAYGLASVVSYLYSISNEYPPPVVQDSVICSDSLVTLSSPVPLTNALWTASSDPSTILATGMSYTFTPDHNDTYRVDGELSPSGCPKHFEFHVGLPVDPNLDLVADGSASAAVCLYNSVQLGIEQVLDPQWFDMHWSPSLDLSDPDIPNPVAHPSIDTWYKLLVTSPVGCGTVLDSVLVIVHPSTAYGIRAKADDDSICAGNAVTLHAQVEEVIRTDAFEGGPASWWSSIQGGTSSALCGSVTGTALYFNGAGARSATTGPLDFSAGGVAHFSLKIATGAAPCDDAEPGEDVVLEYSLDGSTWILLRTFNENAYPVFTKLNVAIPALGPSAINTKLRWRQLSNSGVGQDNWSMDNVLITRYQDDNTGLTWSPAATVQAPNSAITPATPVQDTWFTATSANAFGCSYSDSVRVTVASAFHLLPMNDTTRCGAAGTQLHAQVASGSSATWSWSPANGSLSAVNIAAPIATPSSSTTYSVTATNAIGCSDSGHVAVIVSGLTAVTSGASDLTLCHGEPVNLSAAVTSSAPYSISWTPSATITSPHAATTTASPSDTTTFSCMIIDTPSGCAMSSAVTVNVNPAYVAHLQNDTTVCTALGLQLGLQHNVAAPYQIAWSPAANLNTANIASPTILLDSTATYVVTITDPSGCTVTDSTTIAVAFDNLIPPQTVNACEGGTLLLNAGYPGSTYDWTTNENKQTISVSQSGSYTATITDADQCQAIKTFNAVFNPLPVVDLGPDLALCGDTVLVVDVGNAANSVAWNTGATTHQLTVDTTGSYSVTVTTPSGCISKDTVHVSLDPLPVDQLQDVTSCMDSPTTLNAGNPGSTFQWNTAEATQSITPLASGTYSVTVTTAANCFATFDAQVDLMPLVSVFLGPDTALCADQGLVLDPGAVTGNITWSTSATTPTLSVNSSGTYSVQATNGFCSDADTIVVVFHGLPVDPLTDQTSCIDTPLQLDAGNAGSSYAWSNGASSQSITVDQTGTYSVTITSPDGCSANYSADASFVDPPIVNLGHDTVLCEGQLLDLDAEVAGCTYIWNNGSIAAQLQVAQPGVYSVSVANGYCTAADSVHVLFNPVPSHLATHQYFSCLDDDPHSVAVDAGNPGGTYQWSNGQVAQIAQVSDYGIITVNITNAFGCSLLDSANVVESCQPTIFIPNTFTPNGDGHNDVWLPVGNNVASYEVYIFDRWGGVIFHSTNMDEGWDGTISGNPAPNDVYVWKATYKLQDPDSSKAQFEQTTMGHVQVLR